jgi:FHS family L-fucose permease-like MFS transporter
MSSSRPGFFQAADGRRSHAVAFFLVASLFLLWGFCNGMIDVMDKHFQDKLHLTKAQSAWVQTAHYLGYALMALPAGMLARRFGYKGGIIIGLLLVAVGGFWFIPATHIATFWAFLLGVCFIAGGLTVLETVANPYTTVLGPKQYGAARINLAQSFNGVGWILGPLVGGAFFYNAGGVEVAHGNLWIPYVGVACIVLVMAVIFYFAPLPDLTGDEAEVAPKAAATAPTVTLWQRRHFVGGVSAQFFYVAAQAGIFSFFINYVVEEFPAITKGLADSWLLGGNAVARDGAWFVNEQGASRLLGVLAFPLFLLGRLIGTWLLKTHAANRVLALFSFVNVGLCVVVAARLGWISAAAVLGTFFFMSISFPTIFALAIHGLGEQGKRASAYIVMAILGGAIMPKLMGAIADHTNMSLGFLMPLACFAWIGVYCLFWDRLNATGERMGAPAMRGH